jgi:hypothetical protein
MLGEGRAATPFLREVSKGVDGTPSRAMTSVWIAAQANDVAP